MNEFDKKTERIGMHSHMNNMKEIEELSGQDACKKALLKIKAFLKQNKSGQIILVKGPSASGKTALASELLKEDFLVNSINSVELKSLAISTAESVTQAIRKSIRVRVKETLKVIEGEVTSLTLTKMGLKTLDMESTFEIGDKMQRQIQKEKIVTGDVIRIIKERGKIMKLGISAANVEPDLLGDLVPVSCPEGEMFKAVEEIQNITLHDIDCLNNRTHGYLNLYNGETGEISNEVRKEVNDKIKKWILEGKVVVERGVLIIDNVQMLEEDTLVLLNKSFESSFSPIILLLENTDSVIQKKTKRLNSALVVNIQPMKESDYSKIISSRADFENIRLDSDAQKMLIDLANSYGIDYSLNILDICYVKALNLKVNSIGVEEIKKMVGIFLDEKRAQEIY